MSTSKLSRKMVLAFTALSLAFTGCEKWHDHPLAGTFYGPSVRVGEGTARAWVQLNERAEPTAVGITLSERAVNTISHHHLSPRHSEKEEFSSFTLALPAQKAKTPFDHITLDWNEHGHPPVQIYDKPHFDFHFYMMSEADRQKIGPDDPKSEILPAPQYLPASYVPTPGGAPQMGKHWVYPGSPEFLEGGTFTKTFIYGSHEGKVTFYEPMITLDYLKSKLDATEPIAQPEAYQKSGYYPTQYRVTYDATKKEYRISLEDLILR